MDIEAEEVEEQERAEGNVKQRVVEWCHIYNVSVGILIMSNIWRFLAVDI